ncbi:MAG TPA: hypothetical protein VIY48_13980 [Candidatus Paceibacterota bacterium]
MINPEFTRNLWLEFSIQKLVAMPAILFLIFLAMAMSNTAIMQDTLSTTATVLFITIVWLWGTIKAGASVASEFQDNTWDLQRMSAMQPWDMTWGKLLGSTAYAWYGGIFCLLVAGYYGNSPLSLITLEITALMLHALTFAVTLNNSRLDARLARQNTTGIFIFFITFMAMQFTRSLEQYQIFWWWNIPIQKTHFWFASSVLFAGFAVVAAWRTMRTALQVRSIPWVWPLFTLVIGAYLGGLLNNEFREPWHALFSTTLWAAVIMSYAGLSSDLGNITAWRRLKLLAHTKNLRSSLVNLPTWPSTLILAFLFAMLDTPYSLSSQQIAYGQQFSIAPLAVALMLLRDICIFQFFTLSAGQKRSMAAALVTLLLLDVLIPYLLHMGGLASIAYLILPVAPDSSWINVAVMAGQATIAVMLLRWKLQTEDRLVAVAA